MSSSPSLIQDAVVRSRIEVLNVDRLAYSIVKQARGAPAIADERALRQRWAQAAADAGLTFSPVFLQHEWEQVILAQDLHTEQAYLTCLRTGRGRPLSKTQRSQVWQAAAAGHRRARRGPPVNASPAGQRGHPSAAGGLAAPVPARDRGRGPGSAPRSVAAAARRCATWSRRPVHRQRPAPAHLRQPGVAGQSGHPGPRPESSADHELPDHPGDPGLGGPAARTQTRSPAWTARPTLCWATALPCMASARRSAKLAPGKKNSPL